MIEPKPFDTKLASKRMNPLLNRIGRTASSFERRSHKFIIGEGFHKPYRRNPLEDVLPWDLWLEVCHMGEPDPDMNPTQEATRCFIMRRVCEYAQDHYGLFDEALDRSIYFEGILQIKFEQVAEMKNARS